MKQKNSKKKLQKRIEAYEQTIKNARGKWTEGFHKPGSTNSHKQG